VGAVRRCGDAWKMKARCRQWAALADNWIVAGQC
jgi:hypothetical protein